MNNPEPGCVTLYESVNYGGCSATRCANEDPPSVMPCADDCTSDKTSKNPTGCWGFGNDTTSLKVGQGTVLTLYNDSYGAGTKYEYRANSAYIGDKPNNEASSFKIQKDCDNPIWVWDSDCYDKKSFTFNNSDMNDKRNKYCNSQNLNNNSQCRNWCSNLNNQPNCKNALKEYCNKSENITNAVCKDWCMKNSPECDQGAINYCKTHLDDTTFCGCFDDNMRRIVPDELETLLYGSTNSYGNNNRAICWSKTCGDGGYMTQSMKNLVDGCPECYQVTAKNQILLENVDRSKIQTNYIQSCNTSNTSLNNNTSSSNNNTSSSNNNTSSSNDNTSSSNDNPSKKSLFQIDNSNIKKFIQNLNLETKFPIEYDNFLLNEEDLFILLCILLIILIFIIYNLFIKKQLQRNNYKVKYFLDKKNYN